MLGCPEHLLGSYLAHTGCGYRRLSLQQTSEPLALGSCFRHGLSAELSLLCLCTMPLLSSFCLYFCSALILLLSLLASHHNNILGYADSLSIVTLISFIPRIIKFRLYYYYWLLIHLFQRKVQVLYSPHFLIKNFYCFLTRKLFMLFMCFR